MPVSCPIELGGRPSMQCAQRRVCILLLALAASLASSVAPANEFYQLSTNLGSESNVPRGVDSAHEISSEFLQVSATAGKFFQLGLYDSFTLSGNLDGTYYEGTDGYSNLNLGIQGEFAHKFGFGAYAPRLSAIVAASEQVMRGEARDVRSLTSRLSLSKRFTPGLLLGFGIDYQDNNSPSLDPESFTGAPGYEPGIMQPFEVFDYHASAWFVEGEYSFENGMLLQASYRDINGGTVSSTSTPSLQLYKIARALFNDPGFDSGWFAYLLDADTKEWSAGLSVPVDVDSSVSLRATWHDSDAFGGGNYRNNVISLGYVHNF